MKVEEIMIEKVVVDKLFSTIGNFGNSMSYRERLNDAVIKKSNGYWVGHTMYNILLEFELWNDKSNSFTEKGNKYLEAVKP